MKVTVYLALGGNQGDVFFSITQALSLLSSHPAISSLRSSSFYLTSPFEMQNIHSSSSFLNSVCSFQTTSSPEEIFTITTTIEKQLGKTPKPKTASRPIDIDLLFYGDLVLEKKEHSSLEIPHPRWKDRLFVLIPLRDLTKEIILNTSKGKTQYFLDDLIEKVAASDTSQKISLFSMEKNPQLP